MNAAKNLKNSINSTEQADASEARTPMKAPTSSGKTLTPGPPAHVYNMDHYLSQQFPADVEEFRHFKGLSSGFKNLDMENLLYPGLYVIGSIPSLGKTTFTSQLCDQLAEESGQHILYFSLEMSTFEMATKSLSRLTAKKDLDHRLTAMQIRGGQTTDLLETSLKEYRSFADRITLVDRTFGMTVDDIESFIDSYIQENHAKPVVVVDYLQAIQPNRGSRITTKEQIDMSVQHLKRTQLKYKIILIVISSFNRANYLTQVDYESFKESGGIEYTADVVWGLQLHLLSTDVFRKEKDISKRREMAQNAKTDSPRLVDLICLKNRFGAGGYSCQFKYRPDADLFFVNPDGIEKSLLDPPRPGKSRPGKSVQIHYHQASFPT